jgi:hypothetical protein
MAEEEMLMQWLKRYQGGKFKTVAKVVRRKKRVIKRKVAKKECGNNGPQKNSKPSVNSQTTGAVKTEGPVTSALPNGSNGPSTAGLAVTSPVETAGTSAAGSAVTTPSSSSGTDALQGTTGSPQGHGSEAAAQAKAEAQASANAAADAKSQAQAAAQASAQAQADAQAKSEAAAEAAAAAKASGSAQAEANAQAAAKAAAEAQANADAKSKASAVAQANADAKSKAAADASANAAAVVSSSASADNGGSNVGNSPNNPNDGSGSLPSPNGDNSNPAGPGGSPSSPNANQPPPAESPNQQEPEDEPEADEPLPADLQEVDKEMDDFSKGEPPEDGFDGQKCKKCGNETHPAVKLRNYMNKKKINGTSISEEYEKEKCKCDYHGSCQNIWKSCTSTGSKSFCPATCGNFQCGKDMNDIGKGPEDQPVWADVCSNHPKYNCGFLEARGDCLAIPQAISKLCPRSCCFCKELRDHMPFMPEELKRIKWLENYQGGKHKKVARWCAHKRRVIRKKVIKKKCSAKN